MHFSKTYSQLLHSLPPELRSSAIEYRQLKKLIKQVAEELTALGLSPQVLEQVFDSSAQTSPQDAPQDALSQEQVASTSSAAFLPKITYELDTGAQPQLRLRYDNSAAITLPIELSTSIESLSPTESNDQEEASLSASPASPSPPPSPASPSSPSSHESPNHEPQVKEIVIPLPSDSVFVKTLVEAHQSLSDHLSAFCTKFYANLDVLAREISETARPISETSSFRAHSSLSNITMVRVPTPGKVLTLIYPRSDLYAWREIFQLYTEAEVFESTHEENRGERAISDAEERLAEFLRQLSSRGLSTGSRLKLKQSRHAMQLFIELNHSILNLYKFQYATTEATRKILKKHAKRTALPFIASLPAPFAEAPQAQLPDHALVSLPQRSSTSLARSLVQAIGETIIPIVPSIDDYNCGICLNIAFKPVRLNCGHLFCVRCLVKMQKRNQPNCPMCRSPCVLTADRSNVDWAMLNFMKDWFPKEAHKKLKSNEAEVAKEQMEELGFQTQCSIQ